jgi:hypothetical protein
MNVTLSVLRFFNSQSSLLGPGVDGNMERLSYTFGNKRNRYWFLAHQCSQVIRVDVPYLFLRVRPPWAAVRLLFVTADMGVLSPLPPAGMAFVGLHGGTPGIPEPVPGVCGFPLPDPGVPGTPAGGGTGRIGGRKTGAWACKVRVMPSRKKARARYPFPVIPRVLGKSILLLMARSPLLKVDRQGTQRAEPSLIPYKMF